jgi:competence protein ComEC
LPFQGASPAQQNSTAPRVIVVKNEASRPAYNASALNQNKTVASNTVQNSSPVANQAQNTSEPAQPNGSQASFIPRSVDDNIADGQFDIADLPAAPLNVYAISSPTEDADSIFIEKGSFTMLIDAGDYNTTNAFLSSMNISRLNVVAATRDDPGAVDGLEGIMSSRHVDEFWDNDVSPQSAEYASLLAYVTSNNITVKHPEAGDNLSVSGIEISVLNPQTTRLLDNPDVDGIAIKLSLNGFCALLLNGVVQEVETPIIGSGQDLRCDVMYYYKHGEGDPDPSVLMSYAQPKDVIISVGPNSDGLPSPTTLTRLSLQNVNVWRTDTNGTVVLNVNVLGNYSINTLSELQNPTNTKKR